MPVGKRFPIGIRVETHDVPPVQATQDSPTGPQAVALSVVTQVPSPERVDRKQQPLQFEGPQRSGVGSGIAVPHEVINPTKITRRRGVGVMCGASQSPSARLGSVDQTV